MLTGSPSKESRERLDYLNPVNVLASLYLFVHIVFLIDSGVLCNYARATPVHRLSTGALGCRWPRSLTSAFGIP
jgi:hypothetical protein